ncbi:hypothetical protein D7V97_18080 [Corallococcus sp. CA053C]|uniref:hypothetical protein n=1 Tax=Corallococcus sp. CA053C TaxID=2316732 RepID=UPI000EA1D146|nr:hypothetical protein [Corallococcus sp. CA053C]RKH08923.1 hypothetical protein D7V97_18080 [Corallococcus sp. CA053C]
MTNLDWLKRAAQRSTTEPGLLGQVFATYQTLEHCSPEALADELGCNEQTLQMLALCRKPTGEVFAEQVKAICERFGLAPLALVNVLRQVEIMGEMETTAANDSGRGVARLQLAARDRSRKDKPTP